MSDRCKLILELIGSAGLIAAIVCIGIIAMLSQVTELVLVNWDADRPEQTFVLMIESCGEAALLVAMAGLALTAACFGLRVGMELRRIRQAVSRPG